MAAVSLSQFFAVKLSLLKPFDEEERGFPCKDGLFLFAEEQVNRQFVFFLVFS